MAKFASDAFLDAGADYMLGIADRMIVCAGQPATYAAAVGANALADVAVAGGDFTKADGDVNGRKVTVAAKNAVPVDTTGTADHVAIVDDGGSALIYVTTLASAQGISSGGTVDISAWDIEIADPT